MTPGPEHQLKSSSLDEQFAQNFQQKYTSILKKDWLYFIKYLTYLLMCITKSKWLLHSLSIIRLKTISLVFLEARERKRLALKMASKKCHFHNRGHLQPLSQVCKKKHTGIAIEKNVKLCGSIFFSRMLHLQLRQFTSSCQKQNKHDDNAKNVTFENGS